MAECLNMTPDQLPSLVGRTIGPSDWKDITQREIDLFGEATGDKQWIHCDPERAARESPFRKKTVAHGYFTLALIPDFFFSMLEVSGCRLIVNLGADKIRWPAPVRIPSRVRLTAKCRSVTPFESGVDLCLDMTIEVENQRHPALEAEVSYRYYLRRSDTRSRPASGIPAQAAEDAGQTSQENQQVS